jgi:hypothetical protein
VRTRKHAVAKARSCRPIHAKVLLLNSWDVLVKDIERGRRVQVFSFARSGCGRPLSVKKRLEIKVRDTRSPAILCASGRGGVTTIRERKRGPGVGIPRKTPRARSPVIVTLQTARTLVSPKTLHSHEDSVVTVPLKTGLANLLCWRALRERKGGKDRTAGE